MEDNNSRALTSAKGIPMEESVRSKRMRKYFEKESLEIVDRFVERNKHDFSVKDLHSRLQEYNTVRMTRPRNPTDGNVSGASTPKEKATTPNSKLAVNDGANIRPLSKKGDRIIEFRQLKFFLRN